MLFLAYATVADKYEPLLKAAGICQQGLTIIEDMMVSVSSSTV